MKRASYRHAVAWVADMDESAELDIGAIEALATVLLIADVFGVEKERVARDILRRRSQPEGVE